MRRKVFKKLKKLSGCLNEGGKLKMENIGGWVYFEQILKIDPTFLKVWKNDFFLTPPVVPLKLC